MARQATQGMPGRAGISLGHRLAARRDQRPGPGRGARPRAADPGLRPHHHGRGHPRRSPLRRRSDGDLLATGAASRLAGRIVAWPVRAAVARRRRAAPGRTGHSWSGRDHTRWRHHAVGPHRLVRGLDSAAWRRWPATWRHSGRCLGSRRLGGSGGRTASAPGAGRCPNREALPSPTGHPPGPLAAGRHGTHSGARRAAGTADAPAGHIVDDSGSVHDHPAVPRRCSSARWRDRRRGRRGALPTPQALRLVTARTARRDRHGRSHHHHRRGPAGALGGRRPGRRRPDPGRRRHHRRQRRARPLPQHLLRHGSRSLAADHP